MPYLPVPSEGCFPATQWSATTQECASPSPCHSEPVRPGGPIAEVGSPCTRQVNPRGIHGVTVRAVLIETIATKISYVWNSVKTPSFLGKSFMRFRNMRSKSLSTRRGVATVEWFAILGVVTIAVMWAVTSLGTATQQKLQITGQDIGNPATLPGRFVKGNNGLGNGIDGAPSENAPENDGSGTPGSPGAQGS